jgi:phosphomannomutase/phosphoglucomutase
MITASHNPPEYNGLKIRNAQRTLDGDELQEIYHLAENYGGQDVSFVSGSVSISNPLPDYLERLKKLASFPPNSHRKPLKVVVDGGNGANGPLVVRLLRELGLEVIEMYCQLDGNFPGRGPDPTSAKALVDLAQTVRTEEAQLGLAYDGDGDRLALVDEHGQRVLGDQILMILARNLLKQYPAKIVYELLCTQALADDVFAHGGEPIMTPSGYAFVHEAMREVKGAIGGELSGHLFFNEPDFRFDDAILATVKLLNILLNNTKTLSALVAELPTYFSSPQVRLPCPDEVKGLVVESIQQRFTQDYHVETVDGARIHFAEGWATVRQSNTQPVISMRFEARSAEQLQAIQSRVQSLVEAEISRLREEKPL